MDSLIEVAEILDCKNCTAFNTLNYKCVIYSSVKKTSEAKACEFFKSILTLKKDGKR